MPSKTPSRRFSEIIEEIDFVLQSTDELTFEAFKADPTLRRAIERSYAIISEAAVKLGTEAEDLAPDIPWADIRGLGNVIRHEYGDIDYQTLWEIREDELTPLKTACEKALDRLRGAGQSGTF